MSGSLVVVFPSLVTGWAGLDFRQVTEASFTALFPVRSPNLGFSWLSEGCLSGYITRSSSMGAG